VGPSTSQFALKGNPDLNVSSTPRLLPQIALPPGFAADPLGIVQSTRKPLITDFPKAASTPNVSNFMDRLPIDLIIARCEGMGKYGEF
jgi:hypothetical protein